MVCQPCITLPHATHLVVLISGWMKTWQEIYPKAGCDQLPYLSVTMEDACIYLRHMTDYF